MREHRKHAATLALALLPALASAYDQPTVNMGGTSFFDGAPLPGGPGFYFVEYLTYSKATKLVDNNGNRLGFPATQDISVFAPVTQFIYVPPGAKFGNKQLGFQVLVPWVASAKVDDGANNAVLRGNTGIGDISAGVSVQYDPIMGAQGPLYAQRFELQFILPTGAYDRNATVNPGSNTWAFDPYWAGTLWASQNLSFSWRLHYLWNARNNAPSAAFGNNVSSTQAGQAAHANFAAEYVLNPTWTVGAAGYWLQQVTDTKVNGADVSGRRERVVGLGPAAMMRLSERDLLFFNVYQEFAVRNRAENSKFQIRYDHHF
ncbi:phenol degradation protein meta [Herbaspirillum seropedicae]|uniref:Enzyme involved in meta-pathway of phenol degradation protein n=1 Tax=Herbaspirillum seropedicae (strain SmR1) TaxID=757424 RepID=D8IX11_HERSS|nr:transporter [Herbaspirillum seropedicae]ADJ66048.1 enzyme involved in meta-pathway of phenol degradation protein [Herbaspirillum seropedicae SmR1]AKN67814.1 phenol degradation protein meta [Herbaspirillum seropedicae]NQE29853.1 phenol degradation protein meta [Herbaspirillum seropedicae]UMU23846.1 phenol degradation protein meta [Herbaspirillum seropedicae]